MKNILKKTALLMIPVLLYFCFFAAFEPNNYFGLKSAAAGTAPIGRIKAFQDNPGDRLILGDSRLAHFDMALADQVSGKNWQNLAFGGASLRETLDLLEYCLQKNPQVQQVVLGLSFYTLNASYDTDRMTALEDTLSNPLAYMFNLEYNINALTAFENYLIWRGQVQRGETTDTWQQAQAETETADWSEEDYLLPDGTVSPWHRLLREYVTTIEPVICSPVWAVNQTQFDRLLQVLSDCDKAGIRVSVVLPPMHESVTQLCREKGVDTAMQPVLKQLNEQADRLALVQVLDYEWGEAGKALTLEEWQYYDGFHLDTDKGLPLWTEDLFGRLTD